MKATCPNNPEHNRFYTVAHVAETWEVDEHGEFIDKFDDTAEVTHKPDAGNTWDCAICGAVATVAG